MFIKTVGRKVLHNTAPLCAFGKVRKGAGTLSTFRKLSTYEAAEGRLPPTLPEFEHDDLIIHTTEQSKQHILSANWSNCDGWHAPDINPYQQLEVEPSWTVFSGFVLSESVRICLDSNQQIRLFRPRRHIQHLLERCRLLFLPSFVGNEWLDCVCDLLRIDKPLLLESGSGQPIDWMLQMTMFSECNGGPLCNGPLLRTVPHKVKLMCMLTTAPPMPQETSDTTLAVELSTVLKWHCCTDPNAVGCEISKCFVANDVLNDESIFALISKTGDDCCDFELVTPSHIRCGNVCSEQPLVSPMADTLMRICSQSVVFKDLNMAVKIRPLPLSELKDAMDNGTLVELFKCSTHHLNQCLAQSSNPQHDFGGGKRVSELLNEKIETVHKKTRHHWSEIVADQLQAY